MKRHVLETSLLVKGYLHGYTYRTLILISNHHISILYTIYNLQSLSYDGCLCLRSIFNIFVAYTTFGHYIDIRATFDPGFWPLAFINIVVVKIQAFRYKIKGSPFCQFHY